MYNLRLPENMVKDLYVLREYLSKGPIAKQVKSCVQKYLNSVEQKELGCKIQDAKETIDRHDEQKSLSQ